MTRCWKELTAAWDRSELALRQATDPDRVLELAIVRAGLLDVMEEHDPREFSVWLAEHTESSGVRYP